MLSTPHVIVGATLAIKLGNPLLAIPVAFCSHFALEMLPHWNPHLNTEIKTLGRLSNKTFAIITVDTLTALAAGIFLSTTFGSSSAEIATILASCFAAVLPDLLEVPYFFFHLKNKFLEVWLKSQKAIQSDTNPILGMATQLLIILGSLVWLFSTV